jgi:hypothetical protein
MSFFTDNLPTYLNKAGDWLQNLGSVQLPFKIPKPPTPQSFLSPPALLQQQKNRQVIETGLSGAARGIGSVVSPFVQTGQAVRGFTRKKIDEPIETALSKIMRTSKEDVRKQAERAQFTVFSAGLGAPKALSGLKNLSQEARKFKTAEEFVKNTDLTIKEKPTVLFRGFSRDNVQAQQLVSGKHFSDDLNVAREFADTGRSGTKIVSAYKLSPNAKIADLDQVKAFLSQKGILANKENLTKAIKDAGYDGAVGTLPGHGKEFIITNERMVKDIQYKPFTALTESQLTDIWNQANKASGGTKELGFLKSVTEETNIRVGGQYIPRATDELAIKARNLVRENVKEAERIVLTGTDDKAVATGVELLKHYSDEIGKSITQTVKNSLNESAAKIANLMAQNLMEQGRSIQAAAILSRLTPEGQVRFAAQEIVRYNTSVAKARGGLFGLKKKIPKLTSAEANKIISDMKAIQAMPESAEKAIKFQQLQEFISSRIPSPLINKIIAVWKAGLLTGVKTSGLNIFSNISHAISEIVKDVPAAIVDSVASLFTRKRTLAFTARGIGSGTKEGFSKGWQYLKTGYSERDILIKLDVRKVNFGKGKIARALQKYEETIFRILGSEDQPFYYGAKARSLYSQAIAKAKNAGVRGAEKTKFIENLIQNPTDEMLGYAVLDAETAVYQNSTTLGKIARQIQKAPGGEFVLPFGRTPSAVATQIIHYSPVGLVNTIISSIGKGRFDQRLFSQGIGRGLVGTLPLAVGAALWKKGLVTLDFPSSEKERELWKVEGRTANSIKVGDKWRTVPSLGPAGNIVLIGAHFQKALEESGSPTDAGMKALMGSAKSFTEQTFLTGINNAVSAITDPERSASNFGSSFLSSWIPTIVGDVSRAFDPLERRTSETFIGRAQAKIPGLRQKLEPKVSVLGEERPRVGSFLEVMIDPTRPSPGYETPVIAELRRLWNLGYHASPTLLGDKKGYPALTPQQNTSLWGRAGAITNNKLGGLFSKDEYWKLSDEEKTKTIESFVAKAKLFARAEKVIELTQGLEGEALLTKLKELKAGLLMNKEVFKEYQRLR